MQLTIALSDTGEASISFTEVTIVALWYQNLAMQTKYTVDQEIHPKNYAVKNTFAPPQVSSMFLQRHCMTWGIQGKEYRRSENSVHIPFRSPNTVRRTLGSIYKSCQCCSASMVSADLAERDAAPILPHRLVAALTWPLEQPLLPIDIEQELGTISFVRLLTQTLCKVNKSQRRE